LSERFKIEGYPMLKFFVDGKYSTEYTAGYEATDIVKWVVRKSGTGYEEISCSSVATKVSQRKNLDVVFFGNRDSDLFAVFLKLAKTAEAYNFFASEDICD